MHARDVTEQLPAEISRIPVIDGHEHLMPEKDRFGDDMDVCDLFCHYNISDFLSAEMTEAECGILFRTTTHHPRRRPGDAPLAARWGTCTDISSWLAGLSPGSSPSASPRAR